MKKTLLMYRIILTLLSLLCFFLPGCNKEQQGFEQGKEPKKIYIGIAWVRDWDLLIQGAELAVADANASGGVLQKEIKLVINQEEAKVDDICVIPPNWRQAIVLKNTHEKLPAILFDILLLSQPL